MSSIVETCTLLLQILIIFMTTTDWPIWLVNLDSLGLNHQRKVYQCFAVWNKQQSYAFILKISIKKILNSH